MSLLMAPNFAFKNLTWYLGNSNNDEIPDKKVREVMRQAFKKWSDITNLDFKEDSKRPDIRVRFEMGQHKDVFAFDGPGGVLAHAFYPSTDLNDGMLIITFIRRASIKDIRTLGGGGLAVSGHPFQCSVCYREEDI